MRLVKLFCLTIAFTFVLAVFSACKDNGEQPGTGEPANGTVSYNGEEFWFQGSFIPKNPRDYTDEEKEAAAATPPEYTVEEEAMMAQVVSVEDKYDCVIHCIPTVVGIDSTTITERYSSGEMKIDIYYDTADMALAFYQTGMVEDLNKIEAIDLTDAEKWGTPEHVASCSYGGVQYAVPVIGSLYYPYAQRFLCILMEKQSVYDSFGLDFTPRELDERGQWTFDTFTDVLEQTSSFEPGREIYGIGVTDVAYWPMFPMAAVYANGGELVTEDAEGNYKFGLNSANALNALEWAKSVLTSDNINSTDSLSLDEVYDGGAAFILTTGYRAFQELAENVDDLLWLPFPYGPDVEYGSTTSACNSSTADCATFIFTQPDDDRLQRVGVIFNELFEPTKKYGKNGYNDYLARNYFGEDDPQSYELYLDMSQNYHRGWSLELGIMQSRLVNALIKGIDDPAFDVVSTMNSVEEMVNSQLQTYQQQEAEFSQNNQQSAD